MVNITSQFDLVFCTAYAALFFINLCSQLVTTYMYILYMLRFVTVIIQH